MCICYRNMDVFVCYEFSGIQGQGFIIVAFLVLVRTSIHLLVTLTQQHSKLCQDQHAWMDPKLSPFCVHVCSNCWLRAIKVFLIH